MGAGVARRSIEPVYNLFKGRQVGRTFMWGGGVGAGGRRLDTGGRCDPFYAGPRRQNSGRHAGLRRSHFIGNSMYFRRYENRIETLSRLCSSLNGCCCSGTIGQ